MNENLSLGKARELFSSLIIKVIALMIERGYQPRIGKDGLKHMAGSLHYDGLAMDIELWRDGVLLDKTEDHTEFGRYWESLDPLCFWGGPGLKVDGLKNDGNHYSVTFGGKK